MTATAAEIASQPDTWQTALARAGEFREALAAPGERVLAIGCGTSAFVAQSYAKLREAGGIGETDAAYASELPTGRRYDRVVAITRSGTTTEILTALRGLPAGTRRVVVTAVEGEAVDELADERLVLGFADEASVVQTRFPTTVLAGARAVLGHRHDQMVHDGRSALATPLPVEAGRFDHFVFLGTGWTVGLAHEAALKMRETAQAWSESYPAMDFRHGPVAVATERSLVWAFGEVPEGIAETSAGAGATVYQDADRDPLAQLVLVHRLAIELAGRRGLDPDRPRRLTRSVVLAPAGTDAAR
ncbi:SIS domain-containing protein [Phytohabitans kaempferiae]|uniref:SIS domain-containing protein n=1 Tax=Phytohabitans kaempferiae TaxID=1620943 RepID=A0ABV6LUK3_9ACTN